MTIWSNFATTLRIKTSENNKTTEQKTIAPNFAEIPIAKQEVKNTNAKLDAAGNIPLSNIQKEELPGLSLEKTTKPENNKKAEEKFVKTGESIDERLTRYYTKYKTANKEQKKAYVERYIAGHVKTLKNKSRKEQISIQLADYKKLMHNTRNPDDREMLAEQISALEKENQVLMAKTATVDETNAELKRRGEIGIAKAQDKFHKENQVAIAKIVATSNNKDAKLIGASKASKCDASNQNEVHKQYFITNDKDVQTKLTEQLGKFDKKVQQSIYKRTMTSKHQKVLEQAAGNIYKLHKDNQVPATKMTIATKNKGAIKAGAKNAAKCHKTNQVEIHKQYFETKDRDVQEILTKLLGDFDKDVQQAIYKLTMSSEFQEILELAAERIYTLHKDNQVAATQMTIDTGNKGAMNAAGRNAHKCDESARDEIENMLTSRGIDVSESDDSDIDEYSEDTVSNTDESFEEKTTEEKIEQINEANASNEKALIEKMVTSSNVTEKIQLLNTLPENMLYDFINKLLNDNPSKAVLTEISSVVSKVDEHEKEKILERLSGNEKEKILTVNLEAFDRQTQQEFIKEKADLNELEKVDRSKLSRLADLYFQKQVNRKNEENKK